MDLQTLEMGNILLAKYRLCENMLEYMSDPDAVTGQKYKEQCGEFFKVFHDEMLVFTHELMTKCGEEFENLHCECHTESETPSQPEYGTPPADAKYQIGDRVKVIGGVVGVLKGSIGTIAGYNSDEDGELFGVRLDRFTEDAPLYWYSEDELEPYVEEAPTMKFKEGDIVKILTDELGGKLAKVVYCDYEDKTYRVEPIDDDFVGDLWHPEDSLELYVEPENPEENGPRDTVPTEGE